MNQKMYKIITEEWGIPDIKELNDKKIKFIFDDSELLKKNTKYTELHCREYSAKFCLYDYENKEIIFTMEFYESSKSRFLKMINSESFITLELLNVNNTTMRKKGISSYYIKKLQEYAINRKFSYIKVNPCANAENFENQSKENSLSQEELEKFYLSKSTKEMPIKFRLDVNI
ncbi:hypothetical protein [Clostridium beijerinckii]|uniref:Uncharacterized protein n=1 Tax=Clostridium beijerinckii TaxID=1520 RepID=A0A9Q5CXY9_CLOBE|nr:hypothetical protein [Clostridium beijerinckii]AQS04036.1 hypothetical protein CLBIJ_14510 [Clostridium beijerinckii]MBA2884081.1 hypothetical protein [Clostridium beijerinckii]MBA2899264.1 hypothetical protein [Clostridium beijerinckii]MBA2908666.1 hypothetical protein [Clostridium beijerinckii]MBA9016418.1 hypothetical protein [Clostridium beijerinckii]